MAGIDQAALEAAIANWASPSVRILDPGPQTHAVIPEAWWPVADSPDPEERKRVALSLWNTDFLDLVPRYAEALHTELVDVRLARHPWCPTPSLDYVLRASDGGLRVWMGEDPRGFGEKEPPLFDSVPQSVRTFLHEVHAGYTIFNGLSCGPIPPSAMKTLAAQWEHPDENQVYEWDEQYEFPGTQRLLLVAGRGGQPYLLTSPDLPPGSGVTYFEPDFEVEPFGEALDMFMTMPLEE